MTKITSKEDFKKELKYSALLHFNSRHVSTT